jgi:nucleotide-binding universal stress UspA family protein
MTHVLIAVDDSDHSLRAAQVAYQLFGDNADYTVVSVSDQSSMIWGGDTLMWGVAYPVMLAPSGLIGVTPLDGTDSTPAAREATTAAVEGAMHVAIDVAERADIPEPQVVGDVGDPATAILNAAKHHGADVIVIGTHERSWFEKLMSPSVVGSVLKDAQIPVLIAR